MEGEWCSVRGRKIRGVVRPAWDILRKEVEASRKVVSTYFITDFRENWSARDLYIELKDLGLIEEIVIPPKKDWRGHRFGFVRYINVADERLLETKMNNIWLDGTKLSANISRIKRKVWKSNNKPVISELHNKISTSKRFLPSVNVEVHRLETNKAEGEEGPSKTYADAIRGGKVKKSEMVNEAHQLLFYTSSVEEKTRFIKAKVGVTRKPGDAYAVANSLVEEGIFTISATALGPNLCLLEECVEGDLDTLIQEGGDWLKFWFDEVREWKETDVECARVAHVSIYGVPWIQLEAE